MKLILGSAQLGFHYGYKKKKIEKREYKKISYLIKKNFLNKFDTALNYGESEKNIGKFKVKKDIITKIKLPSPKPKNLKLWFEKSIKSSMKNLKVKKLYGLLFHDCSDIFVKKSNLLTLIKNLKKKKLVSKIGVSIYEKKEIIKILKFWKPDILQIPVNVFDQRFLKNNFLKKLKKDKIEIHARSCFLQGMLLEKKLNFGNYKSKKNFSLFQNWCKNNNLSQLQACLHFVKKIKEIDYLVVGFDNSRQLKQIIYIFNKKKTFVPNSFEITQKNFIDPRKWKIN